MDNTSVCPQRSEAEAPRRTRWICKSRGPTCSASIITFIGENSTNVDRWRTPTVPKAINPAGNNIYGNDGYVMFGTTSTALAGIFHSQGGRDPFIFNSTVSGFPWTTLNVPPSYGSELGAGGGSGFSNVRTAPGFLSMDNPSGGEMKSGVAFAEASSGSRTFSPSR